MILRTVLWCGLVLVAAGMIGFGIWLWRLPAATTPVPAAALDPAETAALLADLRPRRARPLIVTVGLNDATETTDYLVPTGILRRADVADVELLAMQAGPVRLFPALQVEADATVADFDARHPEGADYVIVPAMSRDDDPAVLAWIQAQSRKGAMIIGICAGAKVVGAAGLLDGKRATTHWYYRDALLQRHPRIRYVANRRVVSDGRVATTTGITASLPTMLALIEAIGGRAKADAVAADLGMAAWPLGHDSRAFALTRPFATTVLGNSLAFWRREALGMPLSAGADEVSLALVADAWSRTYRSRVSSYAASAAAVKTRHGIRLLPDTIAADWPAGKRVSPAAGLAPAATLDEVLRAIGRRHGEATADVVAMQLEYPRVGGAADTALSPVSAQSP